MSFNLSDLPTGIVLFLIGLSFLLILNNGIIDFLGSLRGKKIQYITQKSTRIIIAIIGVLLLLSGPAYIFYDKAGELSPDCIYAESAKTDEEAVHWLIDHETQAVVSENLTLINSIFQDNAKIVDYFDKSAPFIWNNPLDRYQTLFQDYEFIDVQNTSIRSMGAINGDTAYYMSGSHGTYIHAGQTNQFQNPDDASHWTATKINGCWKITRFEFNASGIAFP